MNDLFLQYGISGAFIIVLIAFITKIEKRHKEERDEWKKTIDKQFDEANKHTKENTGILQGLKTLLENRNK